MADITNPQIVKFSNERVRTIADSVTRLAYTVDAFLADWNAQGINGLLIADPERLNPVADGSRTDGRPFVTGAEIQSFKAGLVQLQTALNAVIGASAVTVRGASDKIQVNGSVR